MFTVNLHYPRESWAKGAVETIRSANVPQIGQTIIGDRHQGTWVVKDVWQSIQGDILGDVVGVTLTEES